VIYAVWRSWLLKYLKKDIYVKNDYITKVSVNCPVQMEEKIIQLAALLHDVGKFWQDAGGAGTHQELSKRFVEEILQLPDSIDEKLLSTLVLRHHDRSDLSMDLRVQVSYAKQITYLPQWTESMMKKAKCDSR
jgi:hypothetical protein